MKVNNIKNAHDIMEQSYYTFIKHIVFLSQKRSVINNNKIIIS